MFLPKIYRCCSHSVLLSVAPLKQSYWQEEKRNIRKAAPYKWPLNSTSETEPSCMTCFTSADRNSFLMAIAVWCCVKIITVRSVVPGHELRAPPHILPAGHLHTQANAVETPFNPCRFTEIRPRYKSLKKIYQRTVKKKLQIKEQK